MKYFEGENALKNAENWLSQQIRDLDLSICDGIIVENQSSFDLEYVTSGSNTGYPVEDITKSFKKSKTDDYLYSLPPGSVGVQLWRVNHGGVFGKWVGDIASFGLSTIKSQSHVEGFFSVRVRTPGKNYIVPCGFLTGRNRCNKLGLQIRGQDGMLDGRGNVAGHGVDPTGNVTDVVEFCGQVAYAAASGPQLIVEETTSFKIVGKFNNEFLGRHNFIFKNI